MINKHYKHNFDTLVLAAKNDDLALMECTDAVTGEVVITICVVIELGTGEVDFMPVAKLFNGNPYEELNPPSGTEVVNVN